MSDGMGRELAYLSSHATNRYFIPNWGRKVKNAARNFSTITKIALSILKKDKTVKGSINLKRMKAGWDENYLSKLLEANAF